MKIPSLLSFLFLIFNQGATAQTNSIIMSSIGPQEVYEGASIRVFFSTLKHFETIEFTSDALPSFGTLVNEENGSGYFIFDAAPNDIGTYTINLQAESGNLSSQYTFDLVVKEIPDDATVYYVDPENGDENNPGTFDEPFATLTSVLSTNSAAIQGNTFFFLRNGYHGSPVFQNSFQDPVYVLAQRNHTPSVKRLSFSFTSNWYVSNLNISPETNNQTANTPLVNIFAGSTKIVVTNCKIYSIEDASVWTTNEEWYASCGNGIISSGTECLFKNNYLKNTWFSVELRKSDNDLLYNIINWFGADAVRGLANNQRIEYNQIKNATVFDYDHPTQPQHDDAIQSWTFNLPVKNMRIIGNQVADICDPNLPLPTEIMQGIAIFDGFAEDWVVENNIVITHHAHGIALYGAKNCKVTNNSVIRNPFNLYSPSFKPWIRINPRKEAVGGDLSTGNLVRNNIMSTYQDENKEPGIEDYNIIGNNYAEIYEDYEGWNFYLSENSSALNAGFEEDAPFIDINQKRRNIDNIDIGCFENNATLIDRTAPTPPANISTSQNNASSLSLEWEDSQDNTGVAYYEVNIDNKILLSTSSTVYIPGLEPNTEYTISISAVDYFGNASSEVVYNESTTELEMMSIHFVGADKRDHLIKSNSKLMWVGMPFHRIGGYFGNEDASAVLPFQLPCIGGDRQIVSADFMVHLDEIVAQPDGNIDLYGLGERSTSCVAANDHWQGQWGSVPAGTPLVQGFITPETTTGLVELSEPGEIMLGNYLQELYDDGAGCQDFTYLRLNIGLDQEQDNAYYKINAADSRNSFQIPLLKIITSGTSSVKPIEIKNSITILPNPTTKNNIAIQVNGFDGEATEIVIHNANGQQVFKKNFSGSNLNINPKLVSGIYFVTILGQQKYAQTKLIVI